MINRPKQGEGFRLTELVIVMGIIAVIEALLFRRIVANAQAARTGACKRNMLLARCRGEGVQIGARGE